MRQRIDHLSNDAVDLGNEVSVVSGAARTLELRVRKPRRVRRRQGKVQKKRPFGAICRQLRDPIDGALGQRRQNRLVVESFGDFALAPEPRPTAATACAGFDQSARQGVNGAPVFDIQVRFHVQRRRNPEKVVEAHFVRTRGDSRTCTQAALLPVGALVEIRFVVGEAQVPFTDGGRVVPGRLKQRRQRGAFRVDQERGIPPENARLEPRSPRVAPGQQRVPRWRANGRRRVSVRETHPLLRQSVHPWGLDLAVRVVAADVAVAQIIREDEHDVWLWGVMIGDRKPPARPVLRSMKAVLRWRKGPDDIDIGLCRHVKTQRPVGCIHPEPPHALGQHVAR